MRCSQDPKILSSNKNIFVLHNGCKSDHIMKLTKQQEDETQKQDQQLPQLPHKTCTQSLILISLATWSNSDKDR